MKKEFIGTGRRKSAVASVRMREGSGLVIVNDRPFEVYFPLAIQRDTILSPLKKVSEPGKYDVLVRVKGGGIEAQVIAIRLGMSRALIIEDETRKVELKPVGYLTRDPRRKERKKYGLRKARKRSQFSKR
ncbi:30S ribosomal protein S9 [Rhabdochlamydiaceae symbiont of Dictyostelium giganteum]|uniref:30S ribosomal protein S9 n=1 Tax=Rhabdochlamydiaceae symbiont of Dictyostelium giganteum TaxID=3342349 RepID=UPI00384EF751